MKDTLFELLKKNVPKDSITWKCCNYLLNNPIRAFRNSIAHGNWKYNYDFSGLEFWAYKGDPNDGPMNKWEVSQKDYSFWQTLSRLVAYVACLSLEKE